MFSWSQSSPKSQLILHSCGSHTVCVCGKSLQSSPTLCDSMDCSPPGSSVHGIFQARILELVAVPSSRDQTFISSVFCIDRAFFFLPLVPPGKPETHTSSNKTSSMKAFEICHFHLLLLAYINHNLLSAKFSNISCTFPGTR